MSDLDRYLTDEVVEKAARAEWEHEWPDRSWERTPDDFRDFYMSVARISLSAVLPDIIQWAKAEALRDLRDHLAEPRRLWWGVMGVRVVRVIDDPRSVLALSDYLSYRADRIEQGDQP